MKRLVETFLLMFSMLFCFAFCQTKDSKLNNLNTVEPMPINTNNDPSSKVKVKIGNNTFTVTLLANPTAKAFKALLPLSLKMNELNDNEKYAELPKSVPTNASVPKSIQSGDLMMYGSNTLVLFYKGFNTTYGYTKLGRIDDINGLLGVLGKDSVTVSFELI